VFDVELKGGCERGRFGWDSGVVCGVRVLGKVLAMYMVAKTCTESIC